MISASAFSYYHLQRLIKNSLKKVYRICEVSGNLSWAKKILIIQLFFFFYNQQKK